VREDHAPSLVSAKFQHMSTKACLKLDVEREWVVILRGGGLLTSMFG